MAGTMHFVATARTDRRDWLVEAEEPLAGLQLRSGGELPGIVATPALLELVRRVRLHGLRLARAIEARDELEAVTDQGEGLTREQQARVFDKFERLGRSDDGGSGLGLYISRRLARAMGGDLTVESAPGGGACFILDLPAFEPSP